MTYIQNFAFEEHLVRVVAREDGEYWFVAKDICAILGIGNVSMALEKLDEDEKGISSTDTLGGAQDLSCVSEGGLYTLILRSRQAVTPGTVPHRFRRWVAHDILPQIRKTGAYAPEPRPDALVQSIDITKDAPLAARVDAVRLARVLFGADRARQLWNRIGLPDVPVADEWSGSGETKRLLDLILNHELKGGRVRDLILDAYDDDETARLTLADFGVKVGEERDGFWVGSSVPPLRRLMAESAFNAGWLLVLRRIPGAHADARQTFLGKQSRTTWLPLSVLDRDDRALHN